jgi:diguanylate cyclase (GGDEF)-like protein/PAS domain S-box-containing protein
MNLLVSGSVLVAVVIAGESVFRMLRAPRRLRSRLEWRAVFFPADAFFVMSVTIFIDLDSKGVFTAREYLLGALAFVLAVGEAFGIRALLRVMSHHQRREDQNDYLLLRYERLFKGNDMPIIVFDRATLQIEDANSAAEALFGRDGKALLAMPLQSLGFDQDVCREIVRAEEEERGHVDLSRRSADGSEQDLLIHLSVAEVGDSVVAYGIIEDVTERNAARASLLDQAALLEHLAGHDALTGLPNRRVLHEVLERAFARGTRGVPSTLMFIDVDEFKLVNDLQGHQAGDAALVAIARLLVEDVRGGDVVVRVGGDEFAVLLEGMDLPEADVIARRLVASVHDRFSDLGLSIGVASVAGATDTVEVMRRADECMYAAKKAGGNRVIVEGGGDE